MPKHSKEISNRIEEITNAPLDNHIEEAITSFQSGLSLSPEVYVEEIYIVGSVLTEDFTPNESDIDVIVGTNEHPHTHMIDHFFRYWEDRHGYNTALHTNIDINFSKVDVCDVQKNTLLKQDLLREPYHTIKI